MPEYRRPSLFGADQHEVSRHLLSKGIESSTTKDDTAMLIAIAGTSAELTMALSDFANTGSYRSPLPGDLPIHAGHLIAIRNAAPAQLAGMTDAQIRHALQDVCKAIALLLDDRLGT